MGRPGHLARRLRRERLTRGLSLNALAEQSGIPTSTTHRLEGLADSDYIVQSLHKLCEQYGYEPRITLRRLGESAPRRGRSVDVVDPGSAAATTA